MYARGEYEAIERLLSKSEPASPRHGGRTAPHQSANNGPGTTPFGEFGRLTSGIWVPANADVEAKPLDYAATYITLSDVTGTAISLDWLQSRLRQIPMEQALLTIAATMATLRQPDSNRKASDLDRSSLEFFTEPTRTRLARLLENGSVLHAPQLLMILAKLVVAWCPENVPEDQIKDVPLPLLLMVIGDSLSRSDEFEDSESIPVMSSISIELIANHHFNASYDEMSQIALFQRRWFELPKEVSNPYGAPLLADVFRQATGADLFDLALITLALWSRTVSDTPAPVTSPDYFRSIKATSDQLDKTLDLITIPTGRLRELIVDELNTESFDWSFATFGRFPVIKLQDGNLLVLDPQLLFHRCFSWLPAFDIKHHLGRRRRADADRAWSALQFYSEAYTAEALSSLTAHPSTQRAFFDEDLKRAFAREGQRIADAAVDYGGSWVVAEITTRRLTMESVRAASLDALARDRDVIVDEFEQVAHTISAIRTAESRLVTKRDTVPLKFYPLVILTEGFPTNPVMVSLIRDELKKRGLLQDADTARAEVMDIVEVDMLEGISESGGPSLPEILERKAQSNFHADSVRNFMFSMRLASKRPQRVTGTARRLIEAGAARLKEAEQSA